ncbi:MAG: N-acetyltransferase [Methylobacteriaceae bacterium]|nr:N-acetyltransferase [Methylobacteriaceae bacterium]
MDGSFSDNSHDGRFELDVEGQIAFANYRRSDKGLIIFHVETPRALRGQGVAARLMEHVLAAARAEGRELIPFCSYASSWMRQKRQSASAI